MQRNGPARVYVYAEYLNGDGDTIVMEWAFDPADQLTATAERDDPSFWDFGYRQHLPGPTTYTVTASGPGRMRMVKKMPEQPETPEEIGRVSLALGMGQTTHSVSTTEGV